MKYKKMSNRKRTYSNKKSTIFDIALKTKKYKTILLQLIVILRIDFRIKCRKQPSDTEGCKGAGSEVSISCNRKPRKAASGAGVLADSITLQLTWLRFS